MIKKHLSTRIYDKDRKQVKRKFKSVQKFLDVCVLLKEEIHKMAKERGLL